MGKRICKNSITKDRDTRTLSANNISKNHAATATLCRHAASIRKAAVQKWVPEWSPGSRATAGEADRARALLPWWP